VKTTGVIFPIIWTFLVYLWKRFIIGWYVMVKRMDIVESQIAELEVHLRQMDRDFASGLSEYQGAVQKLKSDCLEHKKRTKDESGIT
jgi:hypothetical protein